MNKGIWKLKVGKSEFGDEGCFATFNAAKENPVLEKVFVNENNMSAKGAEAIGDLLPNCATLEHVDLANNEMSDADCEAFAPLTTQNSTLLKLNLAFNGVGDEGTRSPGDALQACSATRRCSSSTWSTMMLATGASNPSRWLCIARTPSRHESTSRRGRTKRAI